MGETLGDALSKMSGLPRREVDAIWEQVKANHARLDACASHKFVPVEPDGQHRPGGKYRCVRCGGTVDSGAADWYRLGREHARKDAGL